MPLSMPVLLFVQVEASCKHRCLEDLTSTTRFVTWSLHTKSHKALKDVMSKLQLTDATRLGAPSSGAQMSVLLTGSPGSNDTPRVLSVMAQQLALCVPDSLDDHPSVSLCD